MTRFISGLVLALFAAGSTGCLVHRHGYGSRPQAVVVREKQGCHPSQYWDGNQCRHKGKGHGARKHDGR